MAIKYYVNGGGVYLGQFDGIDPPAGATEVPSAPVDSRGVWDFMALDWDYSFVPKSYSIYSAFASYSGDPSVWPGNFDFRGQTGGKDYPQPDFDVDGRLSTLTYYRDFDGMVYSAPLYKEDYTYSPNFITKVVSFYFVDDSLSLLTKIEQQYLPDNPVVLTQQKVGGQVFAVLKNLGAPVDAGDAIPKGYADNLFGNAFEQIDDEVAALIKDGRGLFWTYDDPADTLTGNVFILDGEGITWSNVDDPAFMLREDGGKILREDGSSFLRERATENLRADITLAPFTTDDLGEGALNLYFTTARFDARFGTKTTTDLAEGTNLYYTNARFDTRFGSKSTTDLAEGTNLYYTPGRFNLAFAAKTTDDLTEGAANFYFTNGRFDTRFATKSTTDLAEGTNLYFTNERVDDRVAALIQNGTGITWSYNDGANTFTPTVTLAPFSTTDLSEGTNLYYTAARFNTAFAAKTTDDLTEGSINLYYTNARADARIAAQKGVANGIATLDAGGKIPTSQLPALAITSTFVVASQAAQLALTAQEGDVAVRTDQNKSYINNGGTSGTMADWQELLTPTDTILSVNGQTGTVVLTTTNIAEGTNLYYTDERVDDRVAALIQNGTGITWAYNDGANTLTATISLTPFSTTNLSEGTNLYYTAARFNTAFAAKTTTDLAEGTNLYYTVARFDARFATKTTTDLAEGTNLYYTDERVDDRVAVLIQDAGGIRKSYNDAGNALTLNTSFSTQLLNVVDQKTQGTDGGSFTSGAWRTRALNTVRTNEITGASVASNQITLPAGTYYIEWDAPASINDPLLGTGVHQSRLQNITDASTVLVGSSCRGSSSGHPSRGGGRFTLAATKVLELQHQCNNTTNTTGFGWNCNFGVEIYSQVKIWKVF